MDIITFIIIVIIYVIAIAISTLIDDKTYKMYYFIIIALGTLCFINIYIAIYYYTVLRSEDGIPGPPGPQGDKGPKGPAGKCKYDDKCGVTEDDMKVIYGEIADVYSTRTECIKDPNVNNCMSSKEVDRIKPVNAIIQMLEAQASNGTIPRDEFKQKVMASIKDFKAST